MYKNIEKLDKKYKFLANIIFKNCLKLFFTDEYCIFQILAKKFAFFGLIYQYFYAFVSQMWAKR